MSFLDRLFGTEEPQQAPPPPRANRAPEARTDDEIAVERYRYLLRTAPPETIEQVHREAFAKLSDEQRALIYEELSRGAQTGERPLSSEPATLARAATRAELRQPGTMERAFGGLQNAGAGTGRQGPGFGSMVASSLLGTVAGYVIGSALVSAFLPWDAGTDGASADASGADDGSGDSGSDSGDSSGGDSGSGDSGSGGWDGGGGDFGGGGGGDFAGGADFGGGDFGGDFGF